MLGRLLTRLYSRLLKLYPDRFLEEFGGEMGDVFAQALSGSDDAGSTPVTRRLKMARLFLREVWYFPLAYLDARHYQVSLGAGEPPAGRASYGEGELTDTWVGRRASWVAALVGALPFLLFGLAYLLEGFAELGGHSRLAFNLLDGSLNRPAITLTPLMGVYFVSVLGLLFGVLKGFPRWSYAYLGMSLYFGWYYSNGSFYGVEYGSWAWLPSLAAILLGLLLSRSLQPLARLLQGAWNDWTRLSFALYAFAAPMVTIVFFDDDWGVSQLYGLIFDTVLLATMAIAFLRSRTSWSRVLSLQSAVLILVVKGFLGGWFGGRFPSFDEPVRALYFWSLFITIYFGFLLLPALIGLLRRGVHALSSR
jgi:hypothetical protein